MSPEKPLSPEKETGQAEHLVVNGIDQDIARLEEDVKRLSILKERGAVYDPLDEDIEVYDEKQKDVTEEYRETVTTTLQRKADMLEKLSAIRNFWHYFMREMARRNLEVDLLEDLKERLKDFLHENPEGGVWMLQEIRGMSVSLGRLDKEEAHKALIFLRKAVNILKDEELPTPDNFQEEWETTDSVLAEVHKQLEGMVQYNQDDEI